jgi:hypothetical protein
MGGALQEACHKRDVCRQENDQGSGPQGLFPGLHDQGTEEQPEGKEAELDQSEIGNTSCPGILVKKIHPFAHPDSSFLYLGSKSIILNAAPFVNRSKRREEKSMNGFG